MSVNPCTLSVVFPLSVENRVSPVLESFGEPKIATEDHIASSGEIYGTNGEMSVKLLRIYAYCIKSVRSRNVSERII